jgi:aminoglycoside 6'-N-acetyltransferase I
VRHDWTIRAARAGDATAWSGLRLALWPDQDANDLRDGIDEVLADPPRFATFLAFDAAAVAIGFAEASLRHDYVNGTESSPVGFLEGWYVTPASRGQGLGRALVAAVEAWVRGCGCGELASDALLGDTASQAAHAACGFAETDRVVYFRKPMGT